MFRFLPTITMLAACGDASNWTNAEMCDWVADEETQPSDERGVLLDCTRRVDECGAATTTLSASPEAIQAVCERECNGRSCAYRTDPCVTNGSGETPTTLSCLESDIR